MLFRSEEAYRIDNAKFKSGVTTVTDLVLSETQQTRARGGLVSAVTELMVQELQLQKALGGKRPKLPNEK